MKRKLSSPGLPYVPPSLIAENVVASPVTPFLPSLGDVSPTTFSRIVGEEGNGSSERKAIVQLGGQTFSLYLSSDNELQVMTPRQFRITQVLLPDVQSERRPSLSETKRPAQEGHWWTFLPVEVKVLIVFSLVLVFSMVGHYITRRF